MFLSFGLSQTFPPPPFFSFVFSLPFHLFQPLLLFLLFFYLHTFFSFALASLIIFLIFLFHLLRLFLNLPLNHTYTSNILTSPQPLPLLHHPLSPPDPQHQLPLKPFSIPTIPHFPPPPQTPPFTCHGQKVVSLA